MINRYSPGIKKRRSKKAVIAVVCVLAFIFASVSVIGLIFGSDSEERREIKNAVYENEQLKRETENQKTEIEELNKKIDELESELKARPTPSPTPFKVDKYADTEEDAEEKINPRDRREE